jgi:starch phosphorylase
VVFLEDYDISVARYLVQGADVWLNTPRRPNEASGTSGMKLLANGGLNLSILDGWWDEAYDREVGWAIGNGEEYDNPEYQDQVESEALYHILESDVVPLFYDRDAADIPRGWLAKMKASMKRLSPVFSTNRMVAEYAERFYLPAAARLIRLAGDTGRVRSLMDWRKRLYVHGSEVRVTQVDVNGGGREFLVGSKVKVAARVSLGSLSPGDVRVQAYYGSLTADGQIGKGSHVDLSLRQSWGADHLYEGEVECGQSGSIPVVLLAQRDDDLVEQRIA